MSDEKKVGKFASWPKLKNCVATRLSFCSGGMFPSKASAMIWNTNSTPITFKSALVTLDADKEKCRAVLAGDKVWLRLLTLVVLVAWLGLYISWGFGDGNSYRCINLSIGVSNTFSRRAILNACAMISRCFL